MFLQNLIGAAFQSLRARAHPAREGRLRVVGGSETAGFLRTMPHIILLGVRFLRAVAVLSSPESLILQALAGPPPSNFQRLA